MTGTQTLDEFTAKMNGILAANFDAQVPGVTKRSKGLDPQCGLVVGVTPGNYMQMQLARSLVGLPLAWSRYAAGDIHCTFGAMEDVSSPQPDLALTDKVQLGFGYLQKSVLEVLDQSTFEAPALLKPRLLASGDTIILAGEPNPGAFALRGALLDNQAS